MNGDEMLDKIVPEAFLKVLQDQPDAKERRRYALLQAAATLSSSSTLSVEGIKMRVTEAEAMLAEIERRES